MIEMLRVSASILSESGYATEFASVGSSDLLVFEDSTVVGFVFCYVNADDLIDKWERDADAIIDRYRLALRRAGQKAWNTYLVFLSARPVSEGEQARLNAIEEDLGGTRKIARAPVMDVADVRSALLPLLPLQKAPKLEAIDMTAEIQQRTTELRPRDVEAFLSDADDLVVMQVLEESQ